MIPLNEALSALPWTTIGRSAAIVTAAALTISLCVSLVRARSRRLGRRRRLEYALLPDPAFETTIEAVIRFAAQLGRVRRASGLLHHPNANSIRLRFRSVREGQFLTSMVVPEAAAPGLRQARFPEVETRPVDEVVDALIGPSVATGNDRHVAVANGSHGGPSRGRQPDASPVRELSDGDEQGPGDDAPLGWIVVPRSTDAGARVYTWRPIHGAATISLRIVTSRRGPKVTVHVQPPHYWRRPDCGCGRSSSECGSGGAGPGPRSGGAAAGRAARSGSAHRSGNGDGRPVGRRGPRSRRRPGADHLGCAAPLAKIRPSRNTRSIRAATAAGPRSNAS